MRAQRLLQPRPIEQEPLELEEVANPMPGPGEILLRIRACGLCHTDLHIVEGELVLPRRPLTPGHQAVGIVEGIGAGVTRHTKGQRVGVPWLYSTCGRCPSCRKGKENLCDNGRFTGYHADGGFAEYMVVPEDSAYALPEAYSDAAAAPLLCAGVIGYRALRMCGVPKGGRLGLFGFGASAHIAIQIARHWDCRVYVSTRSGAHRALAESLGAHWTGLPSELPDGELESAVIFAPAGELVPAALRATEKGGTVALAGIHMSPIPTMPYALLYQERTLRSVANSTHEDVRELIALAAELAIHTEVETFSLEDANSALARLKASQIRGSGVLLVE